jgi:large subunit ribosomal protein L37Ae
MGRKKKVGTSGRFGPRYGRRLRVEVAEIEAVQRAKHKCPSCGALSVRRQALGVWVCGKCGAKFAGGAWQPGG